MRKDIVNSLTRGNGGPSAIFSFNKDGVGALHGAACGGHLEVCKYLVEDLGGDVNAPRIGSVALGLSLFLSPFSKSMSATPMFSSRRSRLC